MSPIQKSTYGKIQIGRFLGIPEFLYLYGSSATDIYSILNRIGQTFSLNRHYEIGRIRINSLALRIGVWLLLSILPISLLSIFGLAGNGSGLFTGVWAILLLLTGWPSKLYSLPIRTRAKNFLEYIKSRDPMSFLTSDVKSEVNALDILSVNKYFYNYEVLVEILLHLSKSNEFELHECDDFINAGVTLKTERWSMYESLGERLKIRKRFDIIQYLENKQMPGYLKGRVKSRLDLDKIMGYRS